MALIVALGLALIVGLGVAAFLVLRDGDDGPSYPKSWDPQVAPFVTIVEEERGLKFKHPVAVRFLDGDEFEKSVKTNEKDLDKDEKKEIDQATSLFRAFGLISGDVDLFKAFNEATGSGTLAYYSFDDRAITVRGKDLTLAAHATLVHELTHALQDQQFAIADRLKELKEKAEDGEPTTEYDALDAIIEGDAERVAKLYRASLDAEERAALTKAESANTADTLKNLDGIPKVVLTLLGAPYALGQALTEAVAAEDTDDLDALFENPPPDDSVLLDPLKAIGEIEDPEVVEVPALKDGEKKFDSGQMGTLITYLILAERIDLRKALAAADVWNGDAYVAFDRGEDACARVEYAATSEDGAVLLETAFKDWIAAQPGSPATISRDGDRATFESCDPGTAAKLTNDASVKALELVATRSFLASGTVEAGAPVDVARCFAGQMLQEYSIADLTDPKLGADDPKTVKKIQAIVAACR